MLPLKASIYASYSTLVPDWSYIPNRTNKGLNLFSRTVEQNQHYGDLSRKAQRRIENLVRWLVMGAKPKRFTDQLTGKRFWFRVNFITLTLPGGQQLESDNYIKKHYLNHFLTECRKYSQMRNYIWKAEPQRNGAIHFHITTDAFIHWKVIRDTWNRILSKGDYIENYRRNQMEFHKDGFRPRPELFKTWPLANQLEAYRIGVAENWCSPNSTDVHSVKNIKDLPAYLAKYMAKSDDSRRAMDGRLWGCSERLGKVGKLKMCLDEWQREEDFMRFRAGCSIKEFEYCELLRYKSAELISRSTGKLKTLVNLAIAFLRYEPGVDWDYIEQFSGTKKIQRPEPEIADYVKDEPVVMQCMLEFTGDYDEVKKSVIYK